VQTKTWGLALCIQLPSLTQRSSGASLTLRPLNFALGTKNRKHGYQLENIWPEEDAKNIWLGISCFYSCVLCAKYDLDYAFDIGPSPQAPTGGNAATASARISATRYSCCCLCSFFAYFSYIISRFFFYNSSHLEKGKKGNRISRIGNQKDGA